MVIVEVRLFSESTICSGSDHFRSQLVTGKMPFPEFTNPNVSTLISKGRRPPKPLRFQAPGITPAVWKIAEKCWHQKANERPEVNAILQHLEGLANPGTCAHEVPCLEWETTDLQLLQIINACEHHFPNGCESYFMAEHHPIGVRPSFKI